MAEAEIEENKGHVPAEQAFTEGGNCPFGWDSGK
jgi:hypothetical protein